MGKYKVWNKARDCAEMVLATAKNKGNDLEVGRNWRYTLAFWGKGMRGHMSFIREKGLEGQVKADVAKLVARAEAVLEAECDGQDCSFAA